MQIFYSFAHLVFDIDRGFEIDHALVFLLVV